MVMPSMWVVVDPMTSAFSGFDIRGAYTLIRTSTD